MIEDISDLFAVVIALAAFGFSLLGYLQQRRKDRRDLFLQIHERLIDPDLQMGRRLLNGQEWTSEQFERLRDKRPEQYQLINRSLAMFDIFSMYVERKYVDEALVCQEWGHTMARTWKHAVPFMREREKLEGYKPWMSFQRFGPRVHEWCEAHPRS